MDKKWHDPYKVVESFSKGCHKLKLLKGCILKKAYNSFQLKEYLAPIKVGMLNMCSLITSSHVMIR